MKNNKFLYFVIIEGVIIYIKTFLYYIQNFSINIQIICIKKNFLKKFFLKKRGVRLSIKANDLLSPYLEQQRELELNGVHILLLLPILFAGKH